MPNTPAPDSAAWGTAIHEAGHMVAKLVLGFTPSYATVGGDDGNA